MWWRVIFVIILSKTQRTVHTKKPFCCLYSVQGGRIAFMFFVAAFVIALDVYYNTISIDSARIHSLFTLVRFSRKGKWNIMHFTIYNMNAENGWYMFYAFFLFIPANFNPANLIVSMCGPLLSTLILLSVLSLYAIILVEVIALTTKFPSH